MRSPAYAARTCTQPRKCQASRSRCRVPSCNLVVSRCSIALSGFRMDIHPAAQRALQINPMSCENNTNTSTARQDEEEDRVRIQLDALTERERRLGTSDPTRGEQLSFRA